MRMETYLLIIAIVVAAGALGFAVFEHIRTRKLMDSLADMIDSATEGRFEETAFDESMYSLLESRLHEYLSSSAISASKVKEEKDKINALISDISHQTKTPIANLLLYGELLSEEDLSDSSKEKVAAINAQSEKLKFLIDSLVKMSRLENGMMSFVPVVSLPAARTARIDFAQRAKFHDVALLQHLSD